MGTKLMTGTALAIVAYGLINDAGWNNLVKNKSEVRTCSYILLQVDRVAYNRTIQPILESLAGDGPVPTVEPQNGQVLRDAQFFKDQIYRYAPQEITSLILLTLAFIFLTAHLLVACCSDDYEYRTKWAATVQGIVLFFVGFSGIFTAISAYSLEEKSERLVNKFRECRILNVCNPDAFKTEESGTFQDFLAENEFNRSLTAEGIRTILEKNFACQHFSLKTGAAAICGVIVILCCLIICHAMELTTIYDEEDVDEEERARRQAFHLHTVKKSSKTKALEERHSILSLKIRELGPDDAPLPRTSDPKPLPAPDDAPPRLSDPSGVLAINKAPAQRPSHKEAEGFRVSFTTDKVHPTDKNVEK